MNNFIVACTILIIFSLYAHKSLKPCREEISFRIFDYNTVCNNTCLTKCTGLNISVENFTYLCLTFNWTFLYKWCTSYKDAISNKSCVVFMTELPHGCFNNFVIRRYVTYTVGTAFFSNLRCRYEQIFVLPFFVFFSCSFIEVDSLVFSILQFTPESTNPRYVFQRSTLT